MGGSSYDGVGFFRDGDFNFGGGDGLAAELANGFSYTVAGGAGDIMAVLQALSTESLVNVISTPSVMVLDNNVASIQVGDQVPINNGLTVTNGGNTYSEHQLQGYRRSAHGEALGKCGWLGDHGRCSKRSPTSVKSMSPGTVDS